MISRDRLVYVIMRRQNRKLDEPSAPPDTRAVAKSTIGDSIIRAKPTLSQALVHTKR
jgi:hypothetical protein